MSDLPLHEIETLVIGAGPAGALAATLLARAGREVLLADQRFPGTGKVCGEYVGSEGTSVLQRHDLLAELVSEGAAPIASTRIHPAGGEWLASPLTLAPAGAGGLGVSRRLLDGVLRETARREGAAVLDGARLIKLTRQDGRWLAEFRVAGESRRLVARRILGADGRNSRVASLAGLEGRFTPGGVGLQLHFRATTPPTGRVDLFLFPGGYAGLAPIEGDRCCLGALVETGARSLDPFGLLRRRLREGDFPGPVPPASGAALDRASTFPVRLGHRQAISEGLLLAGDAACVTDPFIGQGIALALLGGEAAAEAMILSSHAPARGLRCYREFLRREVFPRAVVAAALRRLMSHPDLMRRFLRSLARRPAATARMVALTRNGGGWWLRALPRAAGYLLFRSGPSTAVRS
ncbi:MAG TPA: FAD-dependent monooxygenase [Candidatus Polarisedimenticolia bacterium]|nr:FAD-dependent monooxygenase [Candidatus Polarisedimenticolia bacterium]